MQLRFINRAWRVSVREKQCFLNIVTTLVFNKQYFNVFFMRFEGSHVFNKLLTTIVDKKYN